MSALGFSNDVIGLFNSLPAVALLLVGIPFAAMADRIGYRPFLLGGGIVAILASLVMARRDSRLGPQLRATPGDCAAWIAGGRRGAPPPVPGDLPCGRQVVSAFAFRSIVQHNPATDGHDRRKLPNDEAVAGK